MTRKTLAAAALAATLLAAPAPASAHHGWAWTAGGNIELTGTIRSAELGNPHGVLTVEADGGQPRSASPGATSAPA